MLLEEHLEPVDSDWMQPEAPPTNAELLLVDIIIYYAGNIKLTELERISAQSTSTPRRSCISKLTVRENQRLGQNPTTFG